MAWSNESTVETIEESVSGDGVGSSTYLIPPGGKLHLDILRIDAGANNEPWLCAIDVSTDPDSRWSDPHHRCQRFLSTQLNPNFCVSGYYAARVWVENDDLTPVDLVEVEIRYRLDGVSL